MYEEAGGGRISLSQPSTATFPVKAETPGGPTRFVCMTSLRSMPDGSNSVLNGDYLVLESPSSPRFDGESWAITGPTWKGFDHIRYIFIL